jgi:ribosomal-protein-alanine N-acetyltransferase
MRLSDIPAVMRIEREAFPVPWKASAYEHEVARNRLASYQVLIAYIGDQPGQIVGYGGYWLLVDEAHVSTIAVHLDWKGKGLGELLLLNMLLLSYKESTQLATLEVRRSNIVAQSLYKKYLFRVVGERIRYYQKREDALIMTVFPLDAAYKSFLNQQKGLLIVKLNRLKEATTI